ncbi:prolipoprotein diacylglyceryl transferase family protein [Spiroplasma monobiae]|uniref:Prolipoprotein diacylglyceryl transferase n=1 Tax=Spiroplasma monobiae MQ-1 TaxID=1336748 RepID=A0A2K9LT97_SPISQ|nr:prolipoprotein diacylglyceryl transferase family protein [Spiroplasma monobiae]AUM62319.1 prolipoprotein diacylglyceryl transferase [Spiroplasma monobiae MQ-1]
MINLLTDINWVNGGKIPSDYGDQLRLMYPILVGFGVFLVMGISALKIWKRKIPLKEFVNAIYISLPIGVIGASIFGKLGSLEQEWTYFYKLFFFWQPGMSFFGSMLCGGTAAFLWFWHKSKTTRVSVYVYADCIVPNILLGQSIGRWGNLFNHEIMGRNVDDVSKINWLPDFIWHRLFYVVDPNTGERLTEIQFKEPLFLYESFATLMLWILITFVFANLAKWISKKPWNVDPINFPCKANKKYKFALEKDLDDYSTQVPVKYQRGPNGTIYLSNEWAWKKAYTLYEPSLGAVQAEQTKINNQKSVALKAREKYNNLVNKINQEIEKEKVKLNRGKITKNEFVLFKKETKNNYKKELKNLRLEKNSLISFMKRNSKGLYQLNNPNNYKITHCGTLSSIYIIGYTIIRFILDPLRNPYELTVKNMDILNYLFLAGFLIFGLIIFVCAQFIAPKKWREEGWLYEKSY